MWRKPLTSDGLHWRVFEVKFARSLLLQAQWGFLEQKKNIEMKVKVIGHRGGSGDCVVCRKPCELCKCISPWSLKAQNQNNKVDNDLGRGINMKRDAKNEGTERGTKKRLRLSVSDCDRKRFNDGNHGDGDNGSFVDVSGDGDGGCECNNGVCECKFSKFSFEGFMNAPTPAVFRDVLDLVPRGWFGLPPAKPKTTGFFYCECSKACSSGDDPSRKAPHY